MYLYIHIVEFFNY